LDLINSKFLNNPFLKIEKHLKRFDFFPVQKQHIINTERMFKSSKILKPEHFDVDFLTEIMPLNKKVVKAQLLY